MARLELFHGHTTIVHCTDPVAALKEWASICEPSEIVAAREAFGEAAQIDMLQGRAGSRSEAARWCVGRGVAIDEGSQAHEDARCCITRNAFRSEGWVIRNAAINGPS